MKRNLFHENSTTNETSMTTRTSMFPKPPAFGLDAARGLVKWLNQTPGSAPKEGRGLVLEALEHLQKLSQLWGAALTNEPAFMASWKALDRILNGITPPKWRVAAQIIGPQPDGTTTRPVITVLSGGGPEDAFHYLGLVSQAGLLHCLRQCKLCQTWFVTTRTKKMFCLPDCQAKFWSRLRKTAQGRKEQRDRMRRLRANLRKRAPTTKLTTSSKRREKS